MNDEILFEIKKMSKLLSLLLTKDFSQTEKIQFLNNIGYPPKEIASMIDTTPNSVSVTLNKLKKKIAGI